MDNKAVDAAIELAVDEKLEDMKQAAAHQYHRELRNYCVWCTRAKGDSLWAR